MMPDAAPSYSSRYGWEDKEEAPSCGKQCLRA